MTLGKNGALLIVLIASLGVAHAQTAQPPPESEGQSLLESMRDLRAQIQELGSTLKSTQAQSAAFQAEMGELRHELEVTRAQLESLKTEVRSARQDPGMTVAASLNSGGNGVSQIDPAQMPAAIPNSAEGKHNSTEERLANLEESQELVNSELKEQHDTKVESASKYHVRLSGLALLNLFDTRGNVDSFDTPTWPAPLLLPKLKGSIGATMRQSQIGLEVFGPELAGAKTSGAIQVDFLGGFAQTLNGTASGIIRLRTAAFRLDWPRTSIIAGQDPLFIAPLAPTSIASIATPTFSYSGNLWAWTPQVRVEHRFVLSDSSQIMVQGGFLDPFSGEPPADLFLRYSQAGESSRQPAYASRVAFTKTLFGEPLTVGAAGYYSRQNYAFGRNIDAWAGLTDWSIPLGHWFLLTGDFFRGRALGGLGGGIGRSVLYNGMLTDPTTQVIGLNAIGGWTQLKFKPKKKIEFNGAFGLDDAFARDLEVFYQPQSFYASSLARNQTGFVNVIYRPRSDLLFSLEFRRLWTYTIAGQQDTANQVNLGMGITF